MTIIISRLKPILGRGLGGEGVGRILKLQLFYTMQHVGLDKNYNKS
jgi:hypothetical protein